MKPSIDTQRRDTITRGIALVITACTVPLIAKQARATPQGVTDLLNRLAAGTPSVGRVNMLVPEIAENGNTVPVTIRIDSPMTDADFVKAVHIAADGNPNPGVASFFFSPASGRAEVQFRIRLAQSQKVVAVAQMSDGSLWSATREVKVALGGCGG